MRSRSCTVPVSFLLPLLAGALFVIQFGLVLSDLPSLKLMQDIICKDYFGSKPDYLLPEDQCHDEPIQQELNNVNVGILLAVTIPSAIVAPFCGMAADRFGRIPVLGISVLGIFLSQAWATFVVWQWRTIPLRAVWALGVPLLLGGGRSVVEAMVFTIISDVVPESKRATWFQWVVGAVLSAQILGALLSRALIKSWIWLPLILSLVLILLGGLVLTLSAPETLPAKEAKQALTQEANGRPRRGKQILSFLFSKPAVLLLPATLLTIPLATVQADFLYRLMPIQFGWPLDRSTLLMSMKSLATLITLLLLLPGLNFLWRKHNSSNAPSFRRDGILARASAALFFFGSFSLAIVSEQSLVIFGFIVTALGSGLPTLSRAMLVSLAEEARIQEIGFMFGMLAIGELLGFIVCAGVMGVLFSAGLSLGFSNWRGLPFCFGLILALGIAVTTWRVPLPSRTSRNRVAPA